MGILVGIDLGTTYSAVASVNEKGQPYIIKNSNGESTTPSVLCFEQNGDVLFGEEAKEQQEFGSENAASFYKRSMGNQNYRVEYLGNDYTPTDLSSLFLKKLVADAEKVSGEKVDGAVITVPAYFAARERQATIDAGGRAGIDVIALLSEPSAAAYAYGLTGDEASKTVLIYDLGGGTFDVTIARIEKDKVSVLGCDGNHRLGGKDWDDALANYLVEMLCIVCDVDSDDVNLSSGEMNALIVQAEQVKRQLSARNKTQVRVSIAGMSGIVEVTREGFEEATAHLLRMTTDVVDKLLEECGLSWGDIDGSLLVGGSTRMPAVRNYLESVTGKKPLAGINPDEAVALGAAVRANMKIKSQYSLGGATSTYALRGAKELVDSTAHALGMIAESPDRSRYINSIIIPKNSPIPSREEKEYSLRVPRSGGLLEVYVLQGSNDRVLDNDVYAKYVIEGIEREGVRESVVKVSYCYTENATIKVSAQQPRIGKQLTVLKQDVEADLSRFDGAPPSLEGARGRGDSGLRVMLCIDVSGSMAGKPLVEAQKAVSELLESVYGSGVQVGLMVFADKSILRCVPTDDYERVDIACRGISIGEAGYGNGAEPIGYWHATYLPRYAVAGLKSRENTRDCLMVLTDGVWSTRYRAIENAKTAAEHGIDIVAIGFGGADRSFLEKIATRPDYASLIDLSELSETFSTIGRAMASNDGLTLS